MKAKEFQSESLIAKICTTFEDFKTERKGSPRKYQIENMYVQFRPGAEYN